MTIVNPLTPLPTADLTRLQDIVLCGTSRAVPGDDLAGGAMSNLELSQLMATLQARLAEGPEPRHIELSSPDFPRSGGHPLPPILTTT